MTDNMGLCGAKAIGDKRVSSLGQFSWADRHRTNLDDEDVIYKRMARIIYETAEFGAKREWEALPEAAKLTWYIAVKRAAITSDHRDNPKASP